MGEDSLGFSGMSIISPQSHGGRLQNWSSKLFPYTKVDMTHVHAPSSTMHRCTTKFWMDTEIWKAIVEGMHGSPFSMSKVISLES